MEQRGIVLRALYSVLLLSATSSAWPFYPLYRESRDVFDNSVDSANGLIAHLSHLEGQLYGLPDNQTGEKVAQWHEGMGVNPEELGEYAEGDILYPASMGRNGVKAETARWPGGVVPYMISPFFNEQQQRLIREAMADYHKNTCIKFKPYTGEETDYIRITAGNTGCWSSVGRIGGPQDVNLQVPGCVTKKGTVIHELMHAVGFLHEQSRYERDEFVRINYHNIQPGREGNFEKSQRSTTDAFGVGYDYGSVMHYSANAFSRNGQPTIVPRGGNIALGQREGFSQRDIQKIRRMYKCSSKRRRSSSFFFF
ncbi:zinc metalloproteinase nas-13-like isoform X2 [Nasonia vitripennis]|uniref:Metalloendopeptidase n=1 Tax=Nasonia vitripennis TaxID=7425 RepID=A0A7M7HCU3_NASVI|nr:zinc metalloproteinase nas-13-like isoform X2 [Nasonia vitripennis]XP_032453638.1 zinc metalloproteinase nas-13-like isoform X2 [Nasonia vitripennis]XP_032453639.1 zinc metalloproteinase nas-13-like isoform X2 [Nasonia vitripennis]XP_032453640.1 zinc metalloproteinase nas-13-like isoform X2 [Nasonia vitripennis]